MKPLSFAVTAGISLVVGLAPFVAGFGGSRPGSSAAAGPRERSFLFTYQVQVPPGAASGGPWRLWIPLPPSDQHQSIGKLSLESAVAHREGRDQEYGNSYAVFAPTAAEASAGYHVTMNFSVTRREYVKDLNAPLEPERSASEASPAMLERYLQPDRLVPLNAVIADLAKEQTSGATGAVEKARRIYTYVASTMRYDKSGEGWGRGDEMWACDKKRGNCTDFHSVLIGMLRSSGIPARFAIGFPVPAGKTEGDIPGYHCWAEFYVQGIGWIPVDASEASKKPARRDYFFGSVDADRVMFTYGRDIRLSPEQRGDPLNYFIYPYAEAGGRPVEGLETHFRFKDLTAGVPRPD